jgi:DNA (cytosine-5)-methyltransferase 1
MAGEPYKVLSLFAGIGGFDLGLERTGGFRTVAFCEIDPFCRRVLAKHWPEVPCFGDIRTLGAEQIPAGVSVICGGFPCQDISSAGSRAGIDGARSGMWAWFAASICALQPLWVIVENVRDLLVRGLDRVLGDLAKIGYDAWWDCIRVSQLGYPHARDRLVLVAYPAALRRKEGERSAQEWRRLIRARVHGRPSAWATAANNDEVRSGFVRVVDGLPNRVDRLGALGNSVNPEIIEIAGRAILEAEGR